MPAPFRPLQAALMIRARRTGGLPAIDIEDVDVVEVVLGPFAHPPAREGTRRRWPAGGGAFALGLAGGLLLAQIAGRDAGPVATPPTATVAPAPPTAATPAPAPAAPETDYAGQALAQFINSQRSLPQRGRDSRPSP